MGWFLFSTELLGNGAVLSLRPARTIADDVDEFRT
jgi:hypothetical protein